ncbi:MAG TPA: hypothetical protein VKV28_03145 [Candidatus Binataceae bacterium]|nr:hypothetical protein [Candidatus Binataceae bacterium]
MALQLLRWLVQALLLLALVGSVALLLADAASARAWAFSRFVALASGHASLSALPLLAAGLCYLALQVVLRPKPWQLFKRLMLGAAFVLWGVVQLMPSGTLATHLGDIVIALYVFDLGLMIHSELATATPAS